MFQKFYLRNQLLIISIAFTFLLLTIRVFLTKSITYSFYAWNIFLAIIPVVISSRLMNQHKISFYSILIFIVWLVFFPNAFYILTDFFHYRERKFVPKWYDLLLVFSAAYNGLLLGIVSLLKVEKFLESVLTTKIKNIILVVILFLSSYGIYIGRYLRFNSWDIVTKPTDVVFATLHFFIKPWQHVYAWGFIVLFTVLFSIVYYSFKQIANTTFLQKIK